jgi:hypothetical protein
MFSLSLPGALETGTVSATSESAASSAKGALQAHPWILAAADFSAAVGGRAVSGVEKAVIEGAGASI